MDDRTDHRGQVAHVAVQATATVHETDLRVGHLLSCRIRWPLEPGPYHLANVSDGLAPVFPSFLGSAVVRRQGEGDNIPRFEQTPKTTQSMASGLLTKIG